MTARAPQGGRRHERRPASRRPAVSLAVLGLVATGLGVVAFPSAASASAPIVVNSTGDAGDKAANDGVCATADGTCTLRAALATANARPDHATIDFALTGTGPFTISPASRLPGLANRNGITINGFSQAGSAPGTDPVIDNAVLQIEVRGQGANGFDALTMTTGGNEFRGLAVYNFAKEFYLNGPSADNNVFEGNHICTNAAGTFKPGALNTAGIGLVLVKGADHNVIGAPGPANRNTISGCAHRGMTMSYKGTSFNKVQNNIIGLNPSGTAALANRSHGVDINYTSDNLVGGDGFQERNVISGNIGSGVEVSHGRGNQRNQIVGNLVGTDLTGNAVTSFSGNKEWGIRFEGPKMCDPCTDAAVPDGIPGFNVLRGNTIVNNAKGGLLLDKGQHDDVISDNRFGVTLNGSPGPNTFFAIRIEHGAHDNVVGPGNEIAYNPKGVTLAANGFAPPGDPQPTYSNQITGNSIHDNSGPGIDLAPFGQPNTGGVGDPLVNGGVQVPLLTGGTSSTVSGTTCSNCKVEVFVADTLRKAFGEGETFLGSGRADANGDFTVRFDVDSPGANVTATATLPGGGTSEFSETRKLP